MKEFEVYVREYVSYVLAPAASSTCAHFELVISLDLLAYTVLITVLEYNDDDPIHPVVRGLYSVLGRC